MNSRTGGRWADHRAVACAIALLLAVVGCAVYANSLTAGFVFDDAGAILHNVTIRDLGSFRVLAPPNDGLPVTGRPLTNLSFAVNYAVHGLEVRGYRMVNVAIHIAAAWLLYAIIRYTIVQPRFRAGGRSPAAVECAAGAVALLWLVHPLQTGAVTYVSQRAESLASALILAALYAFIRSLDSSRGGMWRSLAIGACWAGAGVKEIAAVVPWLIFAYHAIFVSGSWRVTWREHRVLLLGLAASWLPLAWLIAGTENRGGTWAGDSGFTPWEYLRVQCAAVVHYVRLVALPDPLVFDYGRNLEVPAWRAIWPQALALTLLVAWTALSVAQRRAWGFLGLVFFGLLAPTSSFVPLADAIFEHRMYLASAVVIAAVVVPAALRFGSHVAWMVVPAVMALVSLTVARNADFATPVTLWQDTVDKRPTNARAWGNLGNELVRVGKVQDALPAFERAYSLTPDAPLAAHNLAVALDLAGRKREAIGWYRRALELQPRNVLARTNLGGALASEGDLSAAFAEFERVLADVPDSPDARRGYARALLRAGRIEEAITHFARAAALLPRDAEAQFNLGDAFARAGRLTQARDAFRDATEIEPTHAAAWTNLGNTLFLMSDTPAAIAAFEASLRLRDDTATHTNLGLALLMQQRRTEAAAHFEAALARDPDYAPARRALAQLQGKGGVP